MEKQQMKYLIFAGLAIAAIVTTALMMVPQYELTEEFELDDSGEQSVLYVGGEFYNQYGAVIKRTSSELQNVVEPESGEIVESYSFFVGWQCEGTNLDWDSLMMAADTRLYFVRGLAQAFAVDERVIDDTRWSETTAGMKDGEALSTPFVLLPFVPEELKTTDAYTITFVLSANIDFSVDDIHGNHFAKSFEVGIALDLWWSGSSFEVTTYTETTTSPTSTPTTTTTETKPTTTTPVTGVMTDSPSIDDTYQIDALDKPMSGFGETVAGVAGASAMIILPIVVFYILWKSGIIDAFIKILADVAKDLQSGL